MSFLLLYLWRELRVKILVKFCETIIILKTLVLLLNWVGDNLLKTLYPRCIILSYLTRLFWKRIWENPLLCINLWRLCIILLCIQLRGLLRKRLLGLSIWWNWKLLLILLNDLLWVLLCIFCCLLSLWWNGTLLLIHLLLNDLVWVLLCIGSLY